MIINALVKRYEDTPTVPQGWKKRAVSYALDVSEDGELFGVIPLEREDVVKSRNKTKKIMRKMELILPESGVRASGIKGAFLCDDAGYLFGLDEKRGEAKFEADKELHLQILENVDSLSARAIKAWFSSGLKSDNLEIIKTAIPDEKALSQALFIFQVNGKRVDYEDCDMRKAWSQHYSNTDENNEETIRCLVTGEHDVSERIHNKVKLRGGQSAGSNLVSANAESFASYGKTKDDRAADIGRYAAFAHVTALNDLLQDEKHRQFIGGDTLVYWAEGGSGAEEEVFSLMSEPKEEDMDKLDALVKRLASGQEISSEGINLESRFYLLCLSPNAARISVRFFYTDTFGAILENNIEHYRRLEITKVGNDRFQYPPNWMVLSETTVTGKSADATPLLGGQYLHSIITGSRYPMTLYQAILTRVRVNEEINKTKAAIIKAILIKNYKESEVTTVSLNTQTDNKPYALGRLFSVLERLQQQASGGKLNATIRDRYFASACANPGSVFPTILKLSNHHSAKLEGGAVVYYEKLKTELLGKLDVENPFPKVLSLDDQGRFILGYYHQTQEFYTSKKDKEKLNNE